MLKAKLFLKIYKRGSITEKWWWSFELACILGATALRQSSFDVKQNEPCVLVQVFPILEIEKVVENPQAA